MFVDSINQVSLLYGFDHSGNQTVISVFIEGEDLQKVLEVMWSAWPATEMIRQYSISAAEKDQGCYIRDDAGKVRKI